MNLAKDLRKSLPRLASMLRRFAPYIAQERWLLLGAFAALFGQVFTKLLEPWPMKLIFDGVFSDETRLQGWLASLGSMQLLALSVISLVAVVTLRALLQYLTTVAFAIAGNRVLTTIRGQMYEHLQKLPLSYHSHAKGGDLTIRVISDIGMLKEIVVTAFLPLVGNVVILIGMLTIMFIMNWQLALVAIAIFPIFWLVSKRQSKRIHQASRKQRQREGAMAATAAESISAIKLVQSLSLEKTFGRSFNQANNKSLKDGVKVKRLSAALERSVDILVAVATALVLWYGALLVMRGAVTPGDLLVFVSYLKNAFKPMRDFAKYTARIAKATAAGERVLDILDSDLTVRDRVDARKAPPFQADIRFHSVSFGYGEQLILDQLSLHIPAGSSVALVGTSGSGKSTLASLLSRLYDPTAGSISIDGHDIRGFTLRSLRQQISVVLQENLLFSGSIRENITVGLSDVSEEEIYEAAKLAQAHIFIEDLPQGYNTLVGERGATLSGGQRQRIAIARAALRRAPILILDEPTVGLDEENQKLVTTALKSLFKHQTSLLITHDLTFAAQADRVVYLESGQIAEQGSHSELLKQGGRYARLYHQQTESPLSADVAYA